MTTNSNSASTAQANARDDAALTALKLTDTAHWTEVDDILRQLTTSKQDGLSDADAQKRLDEYVLFSPLGAV